MVDLNIPSAPEIPETQDISSLFPSVEDTKTQELSDQYISDLASRWSIETGTAYGDMYQVIKNVGPEGVLTTSKPVDLTTDLIDFGYMNNLTPEVLKEIYNSKKQVQDYVNAAGHNKDIVQGSMENKSWAELTVGQKNTYIQAKVRDRLNREFGDKSFLGSVADFVGFMGYELTVGIPMSLFNYRTATAKDFNDKLTGANTPAEVDAVIDAVFEEGKSRGIFNNNIFNTTYAVDTFLADGQNVDEAGFFLLDLATFAAGPAIKGLRGSTALTTGTLAVARDSVDVAGAVKGFKAADEALAAALDNEATSVQLARQGVPGNQRVAIPSIVNAVSPSINPVLQYENKNYILKTLRDSVFGSTLDETLLQQIAEQNGKHLAKHSNSSLLNYTTRNIDEFGDNREVNFIFGKEDGSTWETAEAAQKAADRIGATVFKTPEGKFALTKTENLSKKGAFATTQESELVYRILGRMLSPEQTSKLDLLRIAKQGDQRANKMAATLDARYVKVQRSISGPKFKEDRGRLNQFISDLQNSGRDRWHSATEFEREWFNKYGVKPDAKITNAFVETMFLNDAKYMMQADVALKRLVNAGVEVADFKNYGELKVISSIKDRSAIKNPTRDLVLNLTTGELETAGKILGQGKIVYTVVDDIIGPNGKAVKLVTGDLSSAGLRRLTHFDALAYNPGGVRETGFKYFIRQVTKGVDLNDAPVKLMPRLIYATGSQAEANKALAQLNNIISKINQLTGSLDTQSLKAFKSSISKNSIDEINKVIRANNDFYPDIENFDDFMKMADETGLDTASTFKVSAKNETLPFEDIDGLNNKFITSSSTVEDVYRYQHNKYGDRYKTLVPYGYNEKIIDPRRAIERDFSREINRNRTKDYLDGAVEGLIKGAKDNNVLKGNFDELLKGSSHSRIKQMEIDTSTKIGKKYELERQVILRNLESKSEIAKNWENFIGNIQETIFDKGVFGLGKGKQYDVFDKLSSDPLVATRGWAFDMKLGMFAFDQLLVQASQIPNIMAISKFGVEAVGELPALRIALVDGRPAVAKHIGGKLQKVVSKLPQEHFEELVDYIKTSGAKKIGFNIQELDAAPEAIGYGVIERVRKLGRAPFNEGDRLTRLTAISAAYREWKAINPTVSLKTKEGLAAADAYIVGRADALTAHMTGVSAASWQKGILSLPTQFYSYSARVFEQLVFGRTLTGAERWRLGLTQLVMYGIAGTGFGYAVDWAMYNEDLSLDKDTYTLVKYGMMDSIISQLTGVDTAISTRLSIGQAIADIFDKVKNENFSEVMLGPVGSVGADVFTDAMRMMYTMVTGNPTSAAHDAKKFWMNVSGFSKPAQAWAIYNTGEYRTKNGYLRATGVPMEAGVALFLGAPLQIAEAQFDAYSLKENEDQFIKEMGKRIAELNKLATETYLEGNTSQAMEVFQQIEDLYKATTPYQKSKILAASRPQLIPSLDKLAIDMQKRGKSAYAERLNQLNNQGTE